MNQIRVGRLLLAGVATLVVWILVEIVVEGVIGQVVLGHLFQEQWRERTAVGDWTAVNHGLNLLIALVNATLLVWLYASLRPMYGVGTKTALITSALAIAWGFSLALNGINLGLFPAAAGLSEAIFEAIEAPVAIIAGAVVYEGNQRDTLDEG